jgi:hypothetical protein
LTARWPTWRLAVDLLSHYSVSPSRSLHLCAVSQAIMVVRSHAEGRLPRARAPEWEIISSGAPGRISAAARRAGRCSLSIARGGVREQAVDGGATVACRVGEGHGWRPGRIIDPLGHNGGGTQLGRLAAEVTPVAPPNRAVWACNLTMSRWPGVVEPARHLVVVPATGGRRRCDPRRGWLVGLPVTGWWVRSWRVGCGGRPIR